jgi:hypothetical protein
MIRCTVLLLLFVVLQSSNKRVLAIYTRDAKSALYKEQLRLLSEDKPGLEDRNIKIETYIYNSKTAAAFNKKQVKGNFAIILTGKDGGDKFRSTKSVTLQKLYSIIDAMPMRIEEMKKN